MTMTRATIAALTLFPLLLTGCGTEVAAPQLSVPPASAAAPTVGGQQSERGNLIKQLGETAAFGPTQSQLVVSFAIDKITVDPKCTSAYAQKSEHGHLVKIDLRAETDKALPTDGFYMLTGWDFATVGADDITETQLVTGASAMCLDESDTFHNAEFAPGSKYRGSIVVDTKNPAGALIMKPSFMLGSGGWEWQYGG
jgi:hypothetical protein